MDKYRKVAEIIATPPNNTKKILEVFERTGFSILHLDDYSDGDHYIVMEKDGKYDTRTIE